MGSVRATPVRCIAVVTLFLLSTLMLGYTLPAEESFVGEETPSSAPTQMGQSNLLSIGSFPDGANTNTRLGILDGEAIQSLDLDLESANLPSSTGYSLTDSLDFSRDTLYDGVDVNGSSLTILPQGWEWDFENSNHGWTLGTPAWLWGHDSILGPTNGVSSGTKAIYTYNGNYPNGLGTTIWATSPVMNCSSCSGSWDLSFMKRLSIESATWDHAYVAVKGTNGAWATVYSSGYTQDSSFSLQTISITNYIANNPSFQVRFGIGTTDSSVNYDGWNVDDVSVMPSGTGVSSGEGNWTSAPFSPSTLGQGEMRTFGYLHLDAEVPAGEILEWQLLDASTSQPIPGFEHSTAKSIDLGMIDWENYPSARLSIHMKSQAGGIPSVHGIHFEGKIVEDFEEDPTGMGWQLQSTTWSPGQISGTGTLVSKHFNIRSGFAGFDSNCSLTGSGQIEYSLDGGGTWAVLNTGSQWLTSPHFTVQFRVISTGGSWTLDTFDVEMVRTSVADGLRIDVGMDGVSDWSMEGQGIGRLGIQDRFSDGSMWQTHASSPAGSAAFKFLLPVGGVSGFEFGVASPAQPMNSPFLTMSIDGQDFMSSSLPNLQDLQVISLSTSELASMNNALSQATVSHGVEGLPMVEVTLRIGSSSSNGDVLCGGLFAPYDSALSLQFDSTDAVVIALNDALQSVNSIGGTKELTLPIRMSSSGAIHLTVVQQSTQSSIEPVSLTVSNVTDTFTPSTDWIEVTSTFDFSNLGVNDVEAHVKANGWAVELHLLGQSSESHIRCQALSLPVYGSAVNGCLQQGTSMIWVHNGANGEVRMLGSGSILQVDHRFKFTEQWNDEESLTASVNMIAPTGPMLPVSMNFGLGSSLGVENDVAVVNWGIVNENQVESILSAPYLNPGDDVVVEVELGFENVPMSPSPRSGSTLVGFLVDGTEIQSSSIISNGIVSFPWTVPVNKESVTLSLDVSPLNGQDIVFDVPSSVVFEFDTVDPELLSVSVSEFDHVDARPLTQIEFIIADRPILPSHAKVHYWRSWFDDVNQDGMMQESEVQEKPLLLPENLTLVQGTYTMEIDTSDAFSGSYFSGWIEVADPAGNMMLASGSFDQPLFNVQINNDGSPQLGSAPASWNIGDSIWIHPGESNVLHLPLWDLNGISDIAYVELDLAGNQNEPVLLKWNATNDRCTSLDIYLDIESCNFIPSQANDLFSSEGTLEVNFSLEWGFDPDVSLLRVPTVFIQDYRGQSNTLSVPELSWKFSGEMFVESDTLTYSIDGNVVDTLGTWVQPRQDIDVSGELTWYRSTRAVWQPIQLELMLGSSDVQVNSLNGTFSGSIAAPLAPGSYGLFSSLYQPPNGAIDRTPTTPPAWFIVDNQGPTVVGVPSPSNGIRLLESTWSEINFELLVSEADRLNESSLLLHWAVHPEGIGLSSQSLINGSQSLTIIGGRAFGDSIPCSTTLNLDELLTSSMRNEALELRVWATGQDMAGHEINPVFNDIDAPLSVWVLEQRIAEYSFSEPEMKPSANFAAGEIVSLGLSITNSGLADGDAQMFVELVESNGARTRIDARGIQIESGSTYIYSKDWIPDRSGTMWIEFQIINGPSAQSETVYVDEARTDGLLGGISSVNPVLLIVIFALTVALVGLLVFGLKTTPQARPLAIEQRHMMIQEAAPPQPAVAPQPVAQGPYGAPQQAASPGENPYQ